MENEIYFDLLPDNEEERKIFLERHRNLKRIRNENSIDEAIELERCSQRLFQLTGELSFNQFNHIYKAWPLRAYVFTEGENQTQPIVRYISMPTELGNFIPSDLIEAIQSAIQIKKITK